MAEKRLGRRWFLAAGVAAVGIVALAGWWFSPGQQQKRRNAVLFEAAQAGDVKAAQAALDGGADVNSQFADGITPLMLAATGNHPEIANPAPTDHPEVIELLIQHGADANAKTDSGFVALFWAARYGHAGVVRVLLANGADVNAKDKDGLTALKWASVNNQEKVVELLKEAGAKE